MASILGKLPSPEEYMKFAKKIDATASDTYRYLNFNELPEFIESAKHVKLSDEVCSTKM